MILKFELLHDEYERVKDSLRVKDSSDLKNFSIFLYTYIQIVFNKVFD